MGCGGQAAYTNCIHPSLHHRNRVKQLKLSHQHDFGYIYIFAIHPQNLPNRFDIYITTHLPNLFLKTFEEQGSKSAKPNASILFLNPCPSELWFMNLCIASFYDIFIIQHSWGIIASNDLWIFFVNLIMTILHYTAHLEYNNCQSSGQKPSSVCLQWVLLCNGCVTNALKCEHCVGPSFPYMIYCSDMTVFMDGNPFTIEYMIWVAKIATETKMTTYIEVKTPFDL